MAKKEGKKQQTDNQASFDLENQPERRESLRKKACETLEESPELKPLYERLIDIDGVEAILPVKEPDLDLILERGQLFDNCQVREASGRRSRCHSNVARLYEKNERVKIATGYGLSADGLWRQHSWGVRTEQGLVLETTVDRLRYFGVILDEDEASDFHAENIAL